MRVYPHSIGTATLTATRNRKKVLQINLVEIFLCAISFDSLDNKNKAIGKVPMESISLH